jgi:hypothetical protein
MQPRSEQEWYLTPNLVIWMVLLVGSGAAECSGVADDYAAADYGGTYVLCTDGWNDSNTGLANTAVGRLEQLLKQ